MRTATTIRFLVLWLMLVFAANGWPQAAPTLVQPEQGFISANSYTNAFFGFSLPFPDVKEKLEPFLPKPPRAAHGIFGLNAEGKKLCVLTITAKFSGNPNLAAQRTVAGPNSLPITEYVLGGRSVFKSESEQKTPAGKLRHVTYATPIAGYVLTFSIDAFNSKLSRKFEESIHSLKFFAPETAKQVAGSQAQPFPKELPQPPSSNRIANLGPGAVSGNTYVNPELGFIFSFPKGWHVVDAATQKKIADAGHAVAWGNDSAARVEHERAARCSRTLLYVADKPVGTNPNQSHSAEIIIAFDTQCLPDAPEFPTSAQDTEAINDVAAAILQSLSATPFRPSRKAVRVFGVQGHIMIGVDGEYAYKPEGESLAVRQNASVMFMELDGYWLTITFSARTEARVQELITQAKMGFTASR